MTYAPRIGSLFSGYGGLDAAALAVLGPSSHVVWHCDIKPAAVTLLEYRDPGVPNLGDITKIDPASAPPVDALTFGWPCQPHSSAGKRLGEADPRALWPEVARLVAGLRPRYLFGENVARVCSNGELRRVVAALAELGYVGTWRTLRASDVGAPHRRDRLFLFAARGDVADAGGGPVAGTAAFTGGGAGPVGLGAAELGGRGGGAPVELSPTPTVQHTARNATANRSPGQEHQNSGWTLTDVHYADRWGNYVAAIQRWERVTGLAAPSPTQDNPRARHGRSLNPAFVEWMMGLPAGWVTEVPGLSRTRQLSLLGDGVVPQQAIAAFTELWARLVSRETCVA